MPPTVSSDYNEPDELGPIAVTVTVPEEFLGFSIDALTTRQAHINGIYNQHGRTVIEASLPARDLKLCRKQSSNMREQIIAVST